MIFRLSDSVMIVLFSLIQEGVREFWGLVIAWSGVPCSTYTQETG
jgi:hypothetical protein